MNRRRRRLAVTLGALAAGLPAAGRTSDAAPGAPARLDRTQSQRCRDWMALVVRAQLEHGPNPRWTHRDCAGLVHFAADEALRPHDVAWKRANGFLGMRVPADVEAAPGALAALRQSWRRADGSRGAFVAALDLVQANTRLVGRELTQAQQADLLFYDVGDDQHLMLWMGPYIAYHTGRSDARDDGLRALRPSQLLAWSDTRWRPSADNPNFAGVYRLDFLA